MSTTWRNERGEEWGKGVSTVTTKGTEWGPYHRKPLPVPTFEEDAPERLPDASESVLGPTREQMEAELYRGEFACHYPGCAKTAKSAAGLAAHARSHK